MTFIEVLNNPTTRDLVDQIEDVDSSLSSYPDGEETLENIRKNLVAELLEWGYDYA